MRKTCLLLVVLLLIQQSYQYTFAVQKNCFSEIYDVKDCDSDCFDKIGEKCYKKDSEVYKSSQCEYVRENSDEFSENETWDEEFGIQWHGCFNKCKDALSGEAEDYMSDYIKCGAENLSFYLVLFIALLGFLMY
ncbi:hypothetical protein PPERSA_13084 [Pseudocohnilembus persalinus]|uniref:Transmembrane protein n=1 Tax=Pseudocohnilembus persalinus TaxID=266149 RepID=A0A0V0QWY8_PSEPJ|nr:hypothetical protein PPERSA_13084 [Pseudocohnilembus persalinus]|eukprot:KRX06605.1 hypothetical protein PPERSA_13084 [Pseudocohnilembus persalinus]